ncbi:MULTISPECIES: phage virion morphogenesis protein [Klebsiella]|uniref:phage virion morphogenesis protein n=1 Tax=Klebsiella TaxID=570 RepID=UPI0007CC83D4|nr:phage virion morphogenesis protein [Klebsiella pneumoniae]MDD9125855.1 phage virion morphogenesis protein [Escherichia coli]MCJ3642880.1 phage virion morphogenesis protein [Klebsiella pneumoniae]MCJ6202195.1 phage virion morphogenesis protein [Klebsiella pneumoniae]MDS6659972.1 phage virion morphogenesis protein [Klebsiella pneumoniae]MDS6979859.1 phage virion morphogenesis protein [Klebsiella pneumoniae]
MAGQQTDPLFQQLDDWLASVAAQLSPGHRRKLTRDVAIGLRKRQQKRIASQKNPSGESYQARRRKILRTQGGIKFIWNDEARELRNWRTTGRGEHRAITGYDVDRGALRTFYKRDIQRYIEINLNQSKQNRTRKDPMFRKLRTARFLKAYGTGGMAVVGFQGHTAEIASVHQYGEVDNVVPGARARYPVRELLGMTEEDLDWLADTVVAFMQEI